MKLTGSEAKMDRIAPDSSEVVQAVCQRLAVRQSPTIEQTEALLEQLAVAEVEIGLLRAALMDATEALTEILQTLARQQKARAVGHSQDLDQESVQQDTLAALYDFLITRAWEHAYPKE